MSIKTGRYGQILWDGAVASPLSMTQIASLDAWKLSLKTDYEDVSAFGDDNKVYVPGLRDISGSVSGFWNSADLTLVQASEQPTPGWLRLIPNSTESSFLFEGLAYMDADIDCSAKGAPKITGTFKAAGPWATP